MDSIPLLKVSFRFSAGVTFMTWKLPTGWCVTSITGCSCMQAKGHCWIRVQQQVFHVTSCCAGGLGARSGCRRAQMSLKGSPAVAVISLSCPLEPLHFLSTFYCFSHHLIKCVKGPGCPYPPLFWWNCPWRCTDGRALYFARAKVFTHFLHDSGRSRHQGSPDFTSKPHCYVC